MPASKSSVIADAQHSLCAGGIPLSPYFIPFQIVTLSRGCRNVAEPPSGMTQCTQFATLATFVIRKSSFVNPHTYPQLRAP